MNCPSCGSRGIGRVGTEQYYCWDCCVEFTQGKSGVRIYEVGCDGELVDVGQASAADSAGSAAE